MNLFNGFSQMGDYFVETEKEKMNIEIEKNKLQEALRSFDQYVFEEKQKIEKEKNQLTNYIKEVEKKEVEMIQKIHNKMIDHELSSTGKIQCLDHTHKSLKTYQQCFNNKIYFKPLNVIYFIKDEINDPRFDNKVKDFFDLFSEKMKKTMNPFERYKQYKILYQKISLIDDLCQNKKNYYDKTLNILKKKHNFKDEENNENNVENDDNVNVNDNETDSTSLNNSEIDNGSDTDFYC